MGKGARMEGTVVDRGGELVGESSSAERDTQITSDFDLLEADLEIKAEIRKGDNPLRTASPERLAQYRRALREVIAARRAGIENTDSH
jgi:hypothetical protein